MQKINFLITVIILFTIIIIFTFKADGNSEYSVCLKNCFNNYKSAFMSTDGRIIDYSRHDITTSEGQSYVMLESVIMSDKNTFDLTYTWAKNNLQRPDKLFAWLWGENKTGEYKILDNNSASDADVDIAFALLLAYKKWNNYQYLRDAKPIINSIWDDETRRVGDYLVLSPGAEQNSSDKVEINPSYFSPYAFRLFQKYDDLHDWNTLIDSSYYYLNKSMSMTKTNLPPNWFLIENGEIVLENSERSDFSYDAIRVFYRVYLDYIRSGEKRALPILNESQFFINKWINSHFLYTNYKSDGNLRDTVQYPGSIAILIPVIKMYNSDVAEEIYNNNLRQNFCNPNYWKSRDDYYSKNLLLFGYYLYNKKTSEYKGMKRLKVKGY